MEREHSVAMEKMKARMVELRSNNVVALDNLRKQHATEKKEWKKMMEQLKLELSSDKVIVIQAIFYVVLIQRKFRT